MKFPDKLTPTGQAEQYTSGEATERFVLVSETLKEFEAVRAALANVALTALQSEVALDPEDARALLDFLRIEQSQQARLTVHAEQAERLAKLIRQGATSVMPEILQNQFKLRTNSEVAPMDDEELTRGALGIADDMGIEVDARRFKKELAGTSWDDFLDSTDEVRE